MSPKRPITILAILICVVVGVAQGQQTYVLGPGDVVEVKVFGQPDLNTTAQVDGDGNLSSLPFLDAISAKCRTEKQVQKDIAVAYSRLIKDPQVSVRVIDRKSRQPAQVSGAVRTPGKVPTERKLRLNELIAASGGITEKPRARSRYCTPNHCCVLVQVKRLKHCPLPGQRFRFKS